MVDEVVDIQKIPELGDRRVHLRCVFDDRVCYQKRLFVRHLGSRVFIQSIAIFHRGRLSYASCTWRWTAPKCFGGWRVDRFPLQAIFTNGRRIATLFDTSEPVEA